MFIYVLETSTTKTYSTNLLHSCKTFKTLYNERMANSTESSPISYNMVMGEPNFELARRLGQEFNPPIIVQEIDRFENLPGQIFVQVTITGAIPAFHECLREQEEHLPPLKLPPIPPFQPQGPDDD